MSTPSQALHPASPRRGHRRPARAARAHALARRAAARAVVDGHQRGLCARRSPTTGAPASTGARGRPSSTASAQFTVPIGGIDLHFIHEPGRRPDAMPLLISHGWPGSVFEFHKLIPLLTEHFTVVAPSLPGYTLSFKPGQKRFGVEDIADVYRGADDGRARLQALRRAGRRLGLLRRLGAGPSLSRARCTGIHLNLLAVRRDPAMLAQPDAGGEGLPRPAQPLPQGGDRLPVDPGHQAADAGLRPDRLARRPRGLDRREVPHLDRLRRQPRERRQPRRDAGQHLALLVHRRDRLVVLALLRAHARPLADPRGRDRRRADGLCRVPEGDPAPAALAGREDLHRHPALERDAEGRALRRAGAARGAGARGA